MTNETPATNPTDKGRDVPLMGDAELRELARDIAMDKVFTDRHIPEEQASMIGSVFMSVGLGGLAGTDTSQVGLIYEYLDKAGPRGINGFPMFMSARIVHVDQVKPLFEAFTEINKAIDAATNPGGTPNA